MSSPSAARGHRRCPARRRRFAVPAHPVVRSPWAGWYPPRRRARRAGRSAVPAIPAASTRRRVGFSTRGRPFDVGACGRSCARPAFPAGAWSSNSTVSRPPGIRSHPRGPTAPGSNRRPVSTARAQVSRSSGGARLDDPGRSPRRGRRRRCRPTCRWPGRPGSRAERGRLDDRGHLDRPAGGVGQRLDERRVGAHPAVDPQGVDGQPAVGLGGLDEVGAPVGDPLQHRPHDVGAGRAPGQPEQRAACAVVPVRRAEAEQRRDVDHAVGVGRPAPRRRGCRRWWRSARGRRAATRRWCRPTA